MDKISQIKELSQIDQNIMTIRDRHKNNKCKNELEKLFYNFDCFGLWALEAKKVYLEKQINKVK